MKLGRYPGGRVNHSLAAALLLLLAAASGARAEPELLGVRLGLHPDSTRVVLDLSAAAQYEIASFSAPDRVIIDLVKAPWALPSDGSAARRGLVEAVRFAHPEPDIGRITLEVSEPTLVRHAVLLPASGHWPYRLVVDLGPHAGPRLAPAPGALAQAAPAPEIATDASGSGVETLIGADEGIAEDGATEPGVEPVGPVAAEDGDHPESAPLAAAGTGALESLLDAFADGEPALAPAAAVWPVPPQKPRAHVAIAAAPAEKHLVVVDAGHGGIDPGAIGVTGTREKDITLAMAKELKRQLEATGRYQVILTRESDLFIPLRDRIKKAREVKADLFLSLHADSHRQRKTRGASVYTLSEKASDAETEALAAKENQADLVGGGSLIGGPNLSDYDADVQYMLLDLARFGNLEYSRRFAESLVKELRGETVLLKKTHRWAAFAVLKAPDVPSVLVEMGYLSSRTDEKLLNSEQHRGRLAASITRAIDAFFNGRKA